MRDVEELTLMMFFLLSNLSISFMQDEIRPLNSLNLNHNLFKLQQILLYDYSITKLKLMLPHKNKCIFYHRFLKDKYAFKAKRTEWCEGNFSIFNLF